MSETFEIQKDCGCIEKHTVSKLPFARETSIKIISECDYHKEQRAIELGKESDFKIFPSVEAKRIYGILDKMIDRLGDEMVDVSYFPEGARYVLKETACKIAEIFEEKKNKKPTKKLMSDQQILDIPREFRNK